MQATHAATILEMEAAATDAEHQSQKTGMELEEAVRTANGEASAQREETNAQLALAQAKHAAEMAEVEAAASDAAHRSPGFGFGDTGGSFFCEIGSLFGEKKSLFETQGSLFLVCWWRRRTERRWRWLREMLCTGRRDVGKT